VLERVGRQTEKQEKGTFNGGSSCEISFEFRQRVARRDQAGVRLDRASS